MVIDVFLPSTIYGGPTTVAMIQARELVRRGHDVTIACSNVQSLVPRAHMNILDADIDGVHVRYFRTWIIVPRFSALVSPSLKHWLRSRIAEFDLVHIHFARDWIPITAALETMRHERALILQTHGMLGRRTGMRRILDWVVVRSILSRATRVLALQEIEKKNVLSIAPDAMVTILPNGIAKGKLGKRWNIETLEKKVVLFLARLHPRKKVLDLIEAVSILHESGTKVCLRIVGPDEGDLAAAKESVRYYGLEHFISFAGQATADEVIEYLVSASVYVLPAVDEPFPMTVLEALAAGVPTIVTEGIHIKELLMERGAAVVVRPGGVHIANAIRMILENEDYASRLSAAGTQLMESELTIENVVTRLEEIYSNAIEHE